LLGRSWVRRWPSCSCGLIRDALDVQVIRLNERFADNLQIGFIAFQDGRRPDQRWHEPGEVLAKLGHLSIARQFSAVADPQRRPPYC
jgi:hypothetical protein